MKNLISVSGKKGSGKNLVAAIITDITYDQAHWEVKSFADKLKYITCSLIGCTREQLENREFKEKELGEEWWYWCIFKTSQRVSYLDNKEFDKSDLSVNLIKPTVRELLQEVGTDAMRNVIHPNIWVNGLFADYNASSKWIISDTRFPNEIESIKKHNGLTIRINRDSFLRTGKVFDTDNHESETALDDYQGFDYVINNNGTIKALKEVVKDILIKEHII